MSQLTEGYAGNGVGINGDPAALDALPPATGTRWVTSRKLQLIAAIRGGLITIEDASRRYSLTIEELSEWQAAFDKHGKRGLRTTFIQQYRFMRGASSERSE